MTSLLRRFFLVWLLAAGVVLTPSPIADAASSAYIVTGQLDNADSPSDLDDGSFVLQLLFDNPVPAPTLSDVNSNVLGFAADSWTIDFFDVTGNALQSYGSEAQPDAIGTAVLHGELTGFDSAQTHVSLSVQTPSGAAATDDRGAVLIDAEFFTPRLVDAFFEDDLAALPPNLSFLAGTVLQIESGQNRLPILSAELYTLTISDSEPERLAENVASEDDDTHNAVPSPTAVGGGLLLLFGVLASRNPRLQRLAAAERF